MKVMCIKEDFDPFHPQPKFGEIDEVINEDVVFNTYRNISVPVYILQRFGIGWGYAKDCFAPISEIDETELVKEREKQLINI